MINSELSSDSSRVLRERQKHGLELFMRKNADYGDSFATFGIIGVIVRIQDKISRIINLLTTETTNVTDESIADTAIDLFNYCTMALMLIDEKRNIGQSKLSRESQMKSVYEHACNYLNTNRDFVIKFTDTDAVAIYKTISQNILNGLHSTHDTIFILDISSLQLSLLQAHVIIGTRN